MFYSQTILKAITFQQIQMLQKDKAIRWPQNAMKEALYAPKFKLNKFASRRD